MGANIELSSAPERKAVTTKKSPMDVCIPMEKVTARSASIFRWRVSGAESFLPGFNRFEVLPPHPG